MKDRAASAEGAVGRVQRKHASADEGPEELLAILQIQQEIAALDADLPRVMTVMVERACTLANADGGAIDLVQGGQLVCHAVAGSVHAEPGSRLGMDSSLAALSMHTADVLVSGDTDSDARVDRSVTRQIGARSAIVVPLSAQGVVIAVLKVMSRQPYAFTESDVANLQILAETLGAIILRHRLAEQLRASESQYRMLYAQNPQPMWVYEPTSFRILAVNQAMQTHYGYTERELLSMTMRDIWFEQITRDQEIERQRLSAQASFNVRRRHRRKDGAPIDVDISSSPILFDGIDARLVSATDVTLRVRAEQESRRDVQTRIEILRIQQEVASLDADLQDVMTVMAERARTLASADGGAVDLLEGDHLVCQARSGESAPDLGFRIRCDSSLAGAAVLQGNTLVCDDIATDPRADRRAMRGLGVRSLIVVPMAVDGQVIGALKVSSKQPGAFAERDVANLQILVETLGATIKRHRISAQLQASEQQYRSLFAENPQPMWVYESASLRLVAVNQAMTAHYGYTEQELLDMTLRDLWIEKDAEYAQSLYQRPPERWIRNIIRRHRRKDGTPIDLELSASPIVFGGAPARMVLAVDVTQRLRAERDLARISRAQRLLSTCNEALIRATSQEGLLQEICRITVEIGDYLGAWVGYARDDEEKAIDQLASAGVMPSQTSLDEKPSWLNEAVRGRGPAGRSIRSGEPVIVENIELEDEALLPRKDRLRAAGIHSMISLPLRNAERTFGVLVLFASEVIEVSSDETRLLQELANDLAFGIGNLRALAMVRDQAALLDKAQDAIIVRGMDDRVLFWNHSAERLYGWTAQEALGTVMWDRMYQDPDAFHGAMRDLTTSGSWIGEAMQRRKDGSALTVEARWTLVRDDQGQPQSILAINTDITERKAAEHKIQRLAFYDPLTQLPNRLLLMDRLQHTLAGAARARRCGALLFIDLDNFKTLNDTLGHEKGDILLQQVAVRLGTCVREADTVARFGGDEFVVVLEDLGEVDAEAASRARAIGQKVLVELARPYLLDGYEYSSSSSIGIAPFGQQHEGASELLKQADLAMYQAKTAGRNAMRFFDPTMQAIVHARVQMEAEMRQALVQGEYALHYQPQFDHAGQVTGVEALLRWRHPLRGLVSPAEFIPLAEETGIIIPLGQWVLQSACAQLNAWRASSSTAHLTMAVNVSARQFHSADFVQQVTQVLSDTGVDAGKLKLELTESMLVNDLELTISKMTELKGLGVNFSLDDFGTGYSSLSYLKRLPLDQLKIDQSFVRDIITDVNDASIVRTVIALGQSLGLAVIAEGVETSGQRDFLASHGCLAYQGYLFSRPLPLQELQSFLLAQAHRQKI